MVSGSYSGRELFYTGCGNDPDPKEGDVLYIDRHIQTPDGGWTRVTKVVLSAPVATCIWNRRALFDYSTCQRSAGF